MKWNLFIFFLLPITVWCQREWTLQKCVDTALQKNRTVRIADIDLIIAEKQKNSEKYNFLPTINGNVAHGYNWGQTIDPFTNQFATNRVQYNNFNFSSSIILFSGLQNQTRKKIAAIDHDIAALNLSILERDVSIEIVAAFLQAKLNEQIIDLHKKHRDFSMKQFEKAKLLQELDFKTKRFGLEAEAQYKKDEYNLTLAKNDYTKALFILQTLIGLTPDSTFTLSDSIHLDSPSLLSEFELNELYAKRSVYEAKEARTNLLPSIAMNGSLGSGYSENNKFLDPNGAFISKPFDTQLNENFYQSVSINLRVPIFNGTNSYTAIKIKELECERISIENNERELLRENKLLEYTLDIENQKQALSSARSSYDSYKLLFDEAKLQLDEQVIDFYSYLQIKDSFHKAEAELVQAEYILRFKYLVKELYF